MRKGFSLVELMIVIAIIGILASIAVPRFQEMALKAKRAEADVNLRGIGDAATAYYATSGTWITGASNPGSPIGKTLRSWRPTMAGWSTLGWSPDGKVRCTYMITPFGSGTWARADTYCDVDGDNDSAIIRYYIATQSRNGYFTDLYPTKY